jgi:predicted transcriptional regulator
MRQIKKTTLQFRVPNELKQQLIKFCEEHDLHSSFVMRRVLSNYLQHEALKADLGDPLRTIRDL